MNEPTLVFLIGYRGSGKTTVARLLAERMGWQWEDADAFLEAWQGRTIRDIFATDGECRFRDLEASALRELSGRERYVIATGGGVVLRAENRQRMRETGRVVWLTADAVSLWQRIRDDVSTAERRPNLAGGGLAEIEELLRTREPFYRECAHITVETAEKLPEDLAEAIYALIREGTLPS